MFFCQICEILENTYFEEHMQMMVSDLYTNYFVFFPLNISPDVAWHISERYLTSKLSMILVILPHLNVMFFTFWFIHKIFFVLFYFLMMCLTWQNFINIIILIHIHTIVMKSIILFLIHSFHFLTLVYDQEKSNNDL